MTEEVRGIWQLWGQIMIRQRQEMLLVQTASHILSPDHWDLQLLDAALPITAQIIHTASDYKRALEEINVISGKIIHCFITRARAPLTHPEATLSICAYNEYHRAGS